MHKGIPELPCKIKVIPNNMENNHGMPCMINAKQTLEKKVLPHH